MSRQNKACIVVAPRQSSIRRDRQNAFLIIAAFPSRLSRYIRQCIEQVFPAPEAQKPGKAAIEHASRIASHFSAALRITLNRADGFGEGGPVPGRHDDPAIVALDERRDFTGRI
jgi:hypothetical protein